MNEQTTILVIDDSATIRRLVDNYLTPEGYRVVLAGTAEEGVSLAGEIEPEMILLDHQLPGTTGYDVCCQLQENPTLRKIPVVISSTLRKKAYVEYADLPNVVDMLPKPYTADLLTTTVKNALDTGAMVVASQTDGSAVPEVIDAPEEASLAGDFDVFTLRETLDFLTNTSKQGVLEVEGRTTRMCFYISDGRIQGATASGLNAAELERTLPEDLKPLAPVFRMTVSGAAGAQFQGLVELLDKRVVDGQLLKRMLRYQASQLLMRSFEEKLQRFQFHVGRAFPDVVKKLPLEVSTLALLVDGALVMPVGDLPRWKESHCFTRRMSRSHSLDRSGMATAHVKLAGLSTQPQTLLQLAEKNGLSVEEAHRVLFGLSLGELVEAQAGADGWHIVAVGFDKEAVEALRSDLTASASPEDWSLHHATDSLALKMLLRRVKPSALVIDLSDQATTRTLSVLRRRSDSAVSTCRLVGVGKAQDKLPLDYWSPLVQSSDMWMEVASNCWGDRHVSPPPPATPNPDNAGDVDEASAAPEGEESGAVINSVAKHQPPSSISDDVSGLESVALLAKLQAQGVFDD